MAKRKRDAPTAPPLPTTNGDGTATKVAKTNVHADVKTSNAVIQIVVGSYERVLHGITASISISSTGKESFTVQFADSFLFNAHASAIRCLALSPLPNTTPGEEQSVYLATGGSDEKINVYSLAASPVAENDRMPSMPSLGSNKISENPRNRELGTLLQHSAHITALHFPTRSKLLSASEDNTVAISRTRDLTVISTVKAPHPKVQGQASGDTAPLGATPAGVNDFAIHPSMKLMVSVGRGEKCMRLWNLVTGKKAGVLNFRRHTLQAVKESKYSSGEGRKIRWNPAGTEFAVAFERGVVMFGEDSKVHSLALPQPLTKVHQICYVESKSKGMLSSMLAVSTEDGRIIFYDTGSKSETQDGEAQADQTVPNAKVLAQIGGKATNNTGRIKDFEILHLTSLDHGFEGLAIVTAGSDGTVRVWKVAYEELGGKGKEIQQVGTLIGTYETGNRITCLRAFVMLPTMDEDVGFSEFESMTEGESETDSISEAE